MEYTAEKSPVLGVPVENGDDRRSRTAGHDRTQSTGTAQLAASIALPGSATWRRNAFLATLLFSVGIIAPLILVSWVFVQRSKVVALALDPNFLLMVMMVGLLAVIARVAAIGEVTVAHRFSAGIEIRALLALLITAGLSAPVLFAVNETSGARSAVAEVFDSGSSEPLFVPEVEGPTVSVVATDPDALTNILIVGGDVISDRWGMRTDTMMLVTIHAGSGRIALTSIPRNLTSVHFPPGSPLAGQFPSGFDDMANALFTHVSNDQQLLDHYGANGLQPEAMALIEGLGYSLNIQIDDFALVNMQGFTELIDAVGGVSLDLVQSTPLAFSLPGDPPLPAEVGPGLVEMDGQTATAYVRSRSADSDYERMSRQRQLLAALGTQISPLEVAGAFASISEVLDASMRTSLSASEFEALLNRLGDNSSISESIGLAPPLIAPASPDYAEIQMIVAVIQRSLIAGVPSGYGG